MKQTLVVLTFAATLMISGCGSESSLPKATGKASLRAINAIPTSPEISFLIEERLIGSAVYQNGSSPVQYDDLSYTFNFEVFFAGESSVRRIARQDVDIEANKIYDFLVSGSLQSPAITVWQSDLRTFDESDTVFSAKFVHASASLGDLDYYLVDPTVAPALGNQLATLSFGQMSEATDLTEGDFVLTITTAGNPNDVVFTSATVTFAARDVYTLTAFDGDASDTAPVFVRAFSDLGNAFGIPDTNFLPTIRFVNASIDLGPSDIYGDEALISQRVADHDFLDVSAELDITVGENTFYYTPAGDTTVVSIETPLTAFGGLRYRLVAIGPAGSLAGVSSNPDIRPVATHAKILPFHASSNYPFLDLYAVEADASIDEVAPIRSGLIFGVATGSSAVPAGTYDLYVTESAEKTVLAGPYRITVAIGDVVDLLVVDTIDPAVLDVLFLSGGPTP
jgi:hypothetical protein